MDRPPKIIRETKQWGYNSIREIGFNAIKKEAENLIDKAREIAHDRGWTIQRESKQWFDPELKGETGYILNYPELCGYSVGFKITILCE